VITSPAAAVAALVSNAETAAAARSCGTASGCDSAT